MKNKKSILIGTTSLVLITLILLGLTYAYYRTMVTGNENPTTISVTGKDIKIVYTDGEATLSTTGNIEPRFTATKEFYVTNEGHETLKYSIILDNMENEFTRTSDWTYKLSVDGVEVKSGILPRSDSYILYSENIDAGETKNYTLVINYVYLEDVDQSDDMGASLSFRINISEDVGSVFISSSEGSLLKAISNDNVIAKKTLTTPGRQVSTSDETVLATTEDDYGISYYFRGNVENNYVTYSNMCWRIVRVQGDGTIKLVLADESHACGNDTGYDVNNGTSAFVDGNSDIKYFYNMTGVVSDFLFDSSDIKSNLDSWVSKKAFDTTKLATAKWCTDTALVDSNKYAARVRLVPVELAEPTLKCNSTAMDSAEGIEASSTIFEGMYGLLTADEIAFAGATYSTSTTENASYYLRTNATGNYGWWTMTPYSKSGTSAYIWVVKPTGNMSDCGVRYQQSLRPSVVLNSNVEISSGNGTLNSPYVIN